MYIFYADESGFSKGHKFEKEQPVTVFGGVLLDLTKLNKAIRIYDTILSEINEGATHGTIKELKFNDIKKGIEAFRRNFPKVELRGELLKSIIKRFEKEISFKIFYTAVDDKNFIEQKKNGNQYAIRFDHSYVTAVYKTISQIEAYQSVRHNNKGNTFAVLDEQNLFQNIVEDLICNPLHLQAFAQIIDTTYFGKSHYSKLIQIADLFCGIIRYYYWRKNYSPKPDYWLTVIEDIFKNNSQIIIDKKCFNEELKEFYDAVEIKKPLF